MKTPALPPTSPTGGDLYPERVVLCPHEDLPAFTAILYLSLFSR